MRPRRAPGVPGGRRRSCRSRRWRRPGGDHDRDRETMRCRGRPPSDAVIARSAQRAKCYLEGMATWAEVETYAADKYRLGRREPTWFSLVWDFGTNTEPVRHEVRVEQIEAFGEPWVLCLSRVCAEPL